MTQFRLIRSFERNFVQGLGSPGALMAGRDVTSATSATMGCGVARFGKLSLQATVNYDEYLYCLEGMMRLRIGRDSYELNPGDACWIPDGTTLTYEVEEKAAVVYAIYPAAKSALD